MFNGLQWWHILLIVAAFILIFGAKKLPDAARGLGRSMRILKSEVSAMHDDDAARKGEPTAPDGTAPAAGAPAPATPAIAPPAAPVAAVSAPVTAAAPATDPVPAPVTAEPVLASPLASGTPATVQATTIDGKPAVIINGVPTLIDQAG